MNINPSPATHTIPSLTAVTIVYLRFYESVIDKPSRKAAINTTTYNTHRLLDPFRRAFLLALPSYSDTVLVAKG